MRFLQIENLSLQYGDQVILNNVNFSIPKGKIIGLLGPNGAGKSSIIKVLAGLVFPKTGILFVNNSAQKTFSDLRNSCGYLIDSPAFYPYLTAKQNLRLLKKINNSTTDINALLIKVGLPYNTKKKVKHFSTGMKQRLAIAQALLRNPELLILDEPFRGLDPGGFLDLKNLIINLNEQGTTIFISSHLLDELEQFADTFILIHNGKIEFQITKEELVRSKKKIILIFEENLSEQTKNYLTELGGVFESDLKVNIHLSPTDIANTVSKLVAFKSTTINIETHTILQEKYFDITN